MEVARVCRLWGLMTLASKAPICPMVNVVSHVMPMEAFTHVIPHLVGTHVSCKGVFMERTQNFLTLFGGGENSLNFNPFVIPSQFGCLHQYTTVMNKTVSSQLL